MPPDSKGSGPGGGLGWWHVLGVIDRKVYRDLAKTYQPRLVDIVTQLCDKDLDREPYDWLFTLIALDAGNSVTEIDMPIDQVQREMHAAIQQVRKGPAQDAEMLALCVLNAAMHYYRFTNDNLLDLLEKELGKLPSKRR